jgi:allantoicase
MIDFTVLPDLASRVFGGGVVRADDEFFAAADHLVLPSAPAYTPRTFDHKGQVYDGWETRRRREPGSDSAIVRLGAPGVVRGVIVDTAFFTGNYPPYASLEGAALTGHPASFDDADWAVLIPKSPLKGDFANRFEVHDDRRFTHVRLTIYPDGGVARLRVHGEIVPDPALLPSEFDVAALENGGAVLDCSNRFYGHPESMLRPGLAQHMGDGWETSRRRDDGNDWVIVSLAAPSVLTFADLDTTHFKGNAPGAARLLGSAGGEDWFELLPRIPLRPDTPHRFPLGSPREVSQVRLDIYPDGGIARLRLIGRPDRDVLEQNFRRRVEPR